MAKEILLSLKIEGTQTAIEQMAKLQTEIQDTQKAVKDLSATDKQAAEQKKIELQQKKDAYNQIKKEEQAAQNAAERNVQTLAKMRAELARLNKTAENAEFGSKAFIKAQTEATNLRKKINDVDQAAGKFQGNVGNYKNAIVDAFQSMGINVGKYTQIVSTATSVQSAFAVSSNAAAASTGLFSTALRVLKVALVSTGIGAIVVLLGTLVAYFTGTQQGADKLTKALQPVKAIFRELSEIIENVGGALVKMFTTDLFQGWQDLKDSISGVNEKMAQALKDAERLNELMIQRRDAELAVVSQEANINRQIAERVKILDDENNSQAVRQKAAEEAVQWQEVLNKLRLDEAKLAEEQFRIENKNDLDLINNQIELQKLINRTTEVETEGLQATKKIRNQLYAIQKKESDAALEAEKKRRESLGYTIIEVKKLSEEIAKIAQGYVADISELPEVNAELYDNIVLGVELAKEATNGIVSEYDKRKKALEVALEEEAITQEEHDKAMLKLNSEYSVAIADQTAAMFNALSEIAGKNSKAGKAFAAASTLIDTYRSAMLAYKAGLELGGPLGLPIAIAQAAIATAFGLSQVKKIYATKDPVKQKYARGVIGLRGAGTETSDSIPADLSKGESVMTAKATRTFAPILAQMEMAVGNRPNYQLGNRRFASGLIGATGLNPNTSIMSNTEQIIRQTIHAIGTIPVTVLESDITSTQNKVRKIKVTGDL